MTTGRRDRRLCGCYAVVKVRIRDGCQNLSSCDKCTIGGEWAQGWERAAGAFRLDWAVGVWLWAYGRGAGGALRQQAQQVAGAQHGGGRQEVAGDGDDGVG